VVRQTVASMPAKPSCKCGAALAHAILTDRDKIPFATREKLKLILGKYLETKTA
jgi:5'-methylthioadenosine phosphorylase